VNGSSKRKYVVISADTHCGASIQGYKPYLEKRYHEEFDRWAATHHDVWADIDQESDEELRVGLASFASPINWDSPKRAALVEQQGIVAEVLFPNTTPPFYPSSSISAAPPECPPADRRLYELRFAGVRAHNRWVADFARELPGRRAALAQVFISDVDDTLAEIKRAHADGCKGVLIPGDQFRSAQNVHFPRYEPVWQLLEELDMTLVRHGTAAGPPNSDENGFAASSIAVLASVGITQRTTMELILSGVFERHPSLRFVTTEVGASWAASLVKGLDAWVTESRVHGTVANMLAHEMGEKLSLLPSEYFARNCYLGTFLSADDMRARHAIGVGNIMWGSDFPHHEGTYPYTTEAMRANFAGVPESEVRMMLGETAARVYGFDLDALQVHADRCGPTVDDLNVPLTPDQFPKYPEQTLCPTFATVPYLEEYAPQAAAASA